MQTRGGEGVRNPEYLADVICEPPLTSWSLDSQLCCSPFYKGNKNKVYEYEEEEEGGGEEVRIYDTPIKGARRSDGWRHRKTLQ